MKKLLIPLFILIGSVAVHADDAIVHDNGVVAAEVDAEKCPCSKPKRLTMEELNAELSEEQRERLNELAAKLAGLRSLLNEDLKAIVQDYADELTLLKEKCGVGNVSVSGDCTLE
jgi:hypothetical protein